ncbi:hypothetical protein [Streptomyces sp. AC550_RSS872]|uniref:hypothetical protein n=1 Tax=Streptomyces sp. AC550_RSS872 TaxID=2823689 RepID=UPI001C2711C1|nr:hypothetical protein [Streptomyces sp. AC550_RSS872]
MASDHDTLPGGHPGPPGSPGWRDALTADIRATDVGRATRALLAFTYDEPEREVIEALLSECLDPAGPAVDPQVGALAVTCVGHVARIHGEVGPDLVARVRDLLQDPVLGGRAEDALDDIASFAPHALVPRREAD